MFYGLIDGKVCAAGSMKRYGVLPSVRLSVCHNSLGSVASGGFTAVHGQAWGYPSIAAARQTSGECEQCHVVSVRTLSRTCFYSIIVHDHFRWKNKRFTALTWSSAWMILRMPGCSTIALSRAIIPFLPPMLTSCWARWFLFVEFDAIASLMTCLARSRSPSKLASNADIDVGNLSVACCHNSSTTACPVSTSTPLKHNTRPCQFKPRLTTWRYPQPRLGRRQLSIVLFRRCDGG